MERIKGDIIASGWLKRSEESRPKLLSQLKTMILEMRELQPPANVGVASVDGGSIFDSRISGSLRHGPFGTIQDFHRHLRMGMEFDPTFDSEVQDMMKQQDNNTWPLKFTHGDLSSLNILVRDDTIVGIIDWETAGGSVVKRHGSVAQEIPGFRCLRVVVQRQLAVDLNRGVVPSWDNCTRV